MISTGIPNHTLLYKGICAVLSRFNWVSLPPYRLEAARFLCPWGSPGKNIGMGCHALLQGYSQPTDGNHISLPLVPPEKHTKECAWCQTLSYTRVQKVPSICQGLRTSLTVPGILNGWVTGKAGVTRRAVEWELRDWLCPDEPDHGPPCSNYRAGLKTG